MQIHKPSAFILAIQSLLEPNYLLHCSEKVLADSKNMFNQ